MSEQGLLALVGDVGIEGVVEVACEADPAGGDVGIPPELRLAGVDSEDDVGVVAHDGPGVEADGEAFGEVDEALLDPVSSVVEVLT